MQRSGLVFLAALTTLAACGGNSLPDPTPPISTGNLVQDIPKGESCESYTQKKQVDIAGSMKNLNLVTDESLEKLQHAAVLNRAAVKKSCDEGKCSTIFRIITVATNATHTDLVVEVSCKDAGGSSVTQTYPANTLAEPSKIP